MPGFGPTKISTTGTRKGIQVMSRWTNDAAFSQAIVVHLLSKNVVGPVEKEGEQDRIRRKYSQRIKYKNIPILRDTHP